MSGICSIWHSGARWRLEHSLYQYHLIHDRWSLPSVQRALHAFQGWGLATVQWAPSPSWEMRFTQCATSPSSILRMMFSQCAVGPSSLLREHCPERWHVPIVCSSPSSLTEPESLPSVQPDPHPWEMKFTSVQPAPRPSWEMRFIQCATSPSSLLRDKVYPVCNQPLIPPKDEVYLLCSGPLIPSER